VAYDFAARIRYRGVDLASAVTGTIEDELTAKHATGGLVAVGADGQVVVAHNSPTIFAAYRDRGELITLT
jgi:beta-aspartyl-peptidase (threonine type)